MWARGWGKPYRISYGLRGTEYEWDDGFLNSLDGYLADKKARRGLTYEHFIDDFIKFQNGDEKAQARADLRDLDKKRMPYKNNLKNNVEAFKNNGGN